MISGGDNKLRAEIRIVMSGGCGGFLIIIQIDRTGEFFLEIFINEMLRLGVKRRRRKLGVVRQSHQIVINEIRVTPERVWQWTLRVVP